MKTKLLAFVLLLVSVLHCAAPIPYVISTNGVGTGTTLAAYLPSGNTNYITVSAFPNTNANVTYGFLGASTLGGAWSPAVTLFTNPSSPWGIIFDPSDQLSTGNHYWIGSLNDLTNQTPSYGSPNFSGPWAMSSVGSSATNGYSGFLGLVTYGQSAALNPTVYNALLSAITTNANNYGNSTTPNAIVVASIQLPTGAILPLSALATEVSAVGTNGDLVLLGYSASGSANANLGGIDFVDPNIITSSEQRAGVLRWRTPDSTGKHGGYPDWYVSQKPGSFITWVHGWTNGETYLTNCSSLTLLSAPPNANVALEVDARGAQFDGAIIGKAASDILYTVTQTNFVINQLYTNNNNGPQQVWANAVLTAAAVAGNTTLELIVDTQAGPTAISTNWSAMKTSVSTIAEVYTNTITGYCPPGDLYYFTNTSSGAGNSAAVLGGQLITY